MITVPACLLLTAAAWRWLAVTFSARTGLAEAPILAVLVAGTAISSLRPPLIVPKPATYSEAAVHFILAGPDSASVVYLVAGSASYEGSFIAAMDLAERPGRHIVLRSSKMLAKSDWSSTDYRLLLSAPPQVAGFLASSPISVIALDDQPGRPDVELLRSGLRLVPSWVEVPAPKGFHIYRRTPPLAPGPVTVRVDMRETLGKYLEWTQ